MSQPLPPFSCTFTPNLPELLWSLKCTLAISTYQAGKVIFISAPERDKLIQLPRNFEKPMGMAAEGNRLAVATKFNISLFNNARDMAPNYPRQPGQYDSLYLPRGTFFTGECDMHDLAWGNAGLIGVNTRFSCLTHFDFEYSFRPFWKPHFIGDLTPDDKCHLNGLAMDQGEPKYVTALGKSDQQQGWRPTKKNGGILMDIQRNEIVADGLSMPHSPRIYKEGTFLLLSATGELACLEGGKLNTVLGCEGFARGLDRLGDFLFIGLSKLRETSEAFRDLPIAKQSVYCGLLVFHLPSQKIVGHLKYENSVEEIYDVKVLQQTRRPSILTADKDGHQIAITLPHASFWAVMPEQNTANS